LGAKSDLVQIVNGFQLDSEAAEVFLASNSKHSNIENRKSTGSFYTPTDVADFFWQEFFDHLEIKTTQACVDFIKGNQFLEPAVGAGSLVFALIKKLCLLGCSASALCKINLVVYDINKAALDYLENQFEKLGQVLGYDFKSISFIHENYLDADVILKNEGVVLFGNPPFVKNAQNSKWKNSFADFVEKSLNIQCRQKQIAFILPLSIAFSRDYASLRQNIRVGKFNARLVNFDNIPDCLFKFGKPGNLNTNRSNSQRCSILMLKNSTEFELHSTPLIRWKKAERKSVLSYKPQYFDVSEFSFSEQFPRVENHMILSYLNSNKFALRLGELVNPTGEISLNVGAVARNYISLREQNNSSVHELKFTSEHYFMIALKVLSSDIFMRYWLTVGDGFHLTKGNIFDFPISQELFEHLQSSIGHTKQMWRERESFSKTKENAGLLLKSYDFSKEQKSTFLRAAV